MIQSIDDVIAALTTIVDQCEKNRDRSGYFAALYKRMTMAVKAGIVHGDFIDGSRMEKLDVTFALRYLNAYEAYHKNSACSASWKHAFDGCINQSLTVIQQLILGINTHINLDLPIASAEVASGNKIYDLEADFNHINNVISSLFDDVQKCLEEVWLPMRLLQRVAATQQTGVLNFSIGAARRAAWANAEVLAGINENAHAAYINQMDNVVYKVAQKVIHPGLIAGGILKMIRITEYDDVARTIKLIDTTVID